MEQVPFTNDIRNDIKFMNFEKWLVDNGAQFPHFELCSMGENVIFIAVVDCLDERSVYEGYRAKRNSNSDNSFKILYVV